MGGGRWDFVAVVRIKVKNYELRPYEILSSGADVCLFLSETI